MKSMLSQKEYDSMGCLSGIRKTKHYHVLTPLVQDLNILYLNEFDSKRLWKRSAMYLAKLVLVTMDLQARLSVLHMTQHNGELSSSLPCNICMIPGEAVKIDKGHIHRNVCVSLHRNVCVFVYEPCCEKTSLQGFRPGPTQNGLYSHRRWLQA